jgi:prepilin-type N-terminal cleavage/methylation domain-containing protein
MIMNRKYQNFTKPSKKFNQVAIGNHGFTLIEVIIALAMISMLMSAIISIFSNLNQSYATQNVAAGIQQVVRTGIDIIAQNIRMAGFNPLKLPDVGFRDDISENRIHFSYDLDEDGTIADDEDITFFLQDDKLKRQIRGGYRISLIENVSDLRFSYLNDNDETAGNPQDIKTVIISMTVTEPVGGKRLLSRTYSTRILCRNLSL